MNILRLERLDRILGSLAAASAVDFHVNEGEIVGLIGPNGAGKRPSSTSCRAAEARFGGGEVQGRRHHGPQTLPDHENGDCKDVSVGQDLLQDVCPR